MINGEILGIGNMDWVTSQLKAKFHMVIYLYVLPLFLEETQYFLFLQNISLIPFSVQNNLWYCVRRKFIENNLLGFLLTSHVGLGFFPFFKVYFILSL